MAAETGIDIIVRVKPDGKSDSVFGDLRRRAENVTRSLGGGSRRKSGGFFDGPSVERTNAAIGQLGGTAQSLLSTPLTLAMNFEQGMTQVRAVTDDATKDGNFDKLSEKARQIGRETEFTAYDASQGLFYLGTAGYNTSQQLATISPVMDAATLSGESLADSSDMLVNVMGGFGLGAEKARDTVDDMAVAALASTMSVGELGHALFKVGPLAKKVGISLEESSALIGVLANAGIKGAEGGTVLRNILLSLAGKPTKDMQRAVKKLGLDTKELRAELGRSGLEGVLNLLMERTKKLDPPMQLFVANVLFGRRTAAGATEIMSKLGSSYVDLKGKIDNSAGASAKAAAEYRSTTLAAKKGLISAFEDLSITLGDELTPTLKEWMIEGVKHTKLASQWIKDNKELVTSVGKVGLVIAGASAIIVPTVSTLSSLVTLVSLGASGFKLLYAGGSLAGKGLGLLGSKLGPLVGSTGGLVGMAALAGVGFGMWADETWGISDSLSGLNTELSIHNDLLDQQLSLQVGLSKVRGAALLGDLTEEEQKRMAAAKAEKEKLSKELSNYQNEGLLSDQFLYGDDGTFFGIGDGRGTGEINAEIQRQQAIIDSINKKGLERHDEAATRGEAFQIRKRAGIAGEQGVISTLGFDASRPGVDKLDAQVSALLAQVQKESAKLKIEVSDERVKVTEVGGNLPLEVDEGRV